AFTAGEEWSEVRLPLDGFVGADLAQLRAIAFTAGKPDGGFEFFLDHVELRCRARSRQQAPRRAVAAAMRHHVRRYRLRGERVNSRRLPAWLLPAPDSLLARTIRRGRAPWTEFVHLAWSAWIFITPIFAPGGYDLRWLLLTLASFPLFVLLYTLCLVAPRR